jgi:hypothetical protein
MDAFTRQAKAALVRYLGDIFKPQIVMGAKGVAKDVSGAERNEQITGTGL